jgi:hypothetical protein
MTRTERELRAIYTDLEREPMSELRLREWLDGVAVPTHHRGSSRHRWAVVASAAAVAAVAVATAVAAGSRSHHGVPAGSPATVRTSADAEVAPTPQVAAQTLLDLLPRRGSVSELSGVTIDKHPQAELVYDDGQGAARLTVSLDLPPAEWPRPQCRAGQPYCRVLPDGTIVTWQTVQDPKEPKIAGQMWTANASRPNGFAVTVTEYTSAVPKIGPVTRAVPPLTVDELKAIVSSSRWQSSVTAEAAQQDEQLFTPKPDTTRAATPSSTDNPTFGRTGQSYAPPSGTR